MTGFTKSYIKEFLIWSILIGTVAGVILAYTVFDEITTKCVTELTLKPLFVSTAVTTLLPSVLSIPAALISVTRAGRGCVDLPPSFGKWLIRYALVILALTAAVGIIDWTTSQSTAETIRKLVDLREYYGNSILTDRIRGALSSFKTDSLLTELGMLGIAAAVTVVSLPLIKRRYESC